MKTIRVLIILIIVAAGAAVAYAYSGWYDVSVGAGHNPVTEWYLETLRERSIESRAASIQVPALDDPAMVQAGALHYDDGCAGCHGKPDRDPADIFEPRPPALARHAEEPAEAYWVIQNGIKMSAMPIKGRGHTEEEVWSIVAFLQKLPELTPAEYKTMVEKARASDAHQHSHGDAEASTETGHAQETPDDPVAAVEAFHHALAEGNRDAALSLLHKNATILEGGHLQTKSEYASDHLASDMAFLGDATMERGTQDVSADDKQATVTSQARITATVEGRKEVRNVLETVSLIRTDAGWRITHVHWASADSGKNPETGESSGQPAQTEG